jgi:hypothetical protein
LEIYNEEVYDLLTCQPTKLIVQGEFVWTCKFRLESLGIWRLNIWIRFYVFYNRKKDN